MSYAHKELEVRLVIDAIHAYKIYLITRYRREESVSHTLEFEFYIIVTRAVHCEGEYLPLINKR